MAEQPTYAELVEALKAFVTACREQDIRLGPITGTALALLARLEEGA